MAVEFSEEFLKRIIREFGKKQSHTIIDILEKTQLTEGKFLAQIGKIILKEKKIKSHRFYFIHDKNNIKILNEEELKEHILRFIALSKKNNQQKTIEKFKKDLKEANFNF